MTHNLIHLLAQEGNGAVEVDNPAGEPILVVVIGPIKHWWTRMETPEYKAYAEWREAVRVSLIHAGHLVYAPHKAWQGAWHEKAQIVNDAAIREANVVVVVTPDGVPAVGTAAEIAVAEAHNVPVLHAPPADDEALALLLLTIQETYGHHGRTT